MPRIQGIYRVANSVTDEAYIGSSTDVYRRWTDHRRELRNRSHKNALLQAAWARDGEGVFHFSMLEQVEQRDDLIRREQHYLDLLQPAYNEGVTAVRAPFRTWRSDETDRKRFWSKVAKTESGCWLWQGARLPAGYGCFKVAGKMLKAHRVAYSYTQGPVAGNLVVCHRCDNPRCVRPDHLFVGTHKDNATDREAKGRGYFSRPESRAVKQVPLEKHWCHLAPERQQGERNHNARLTETQVEVIRNRYERKEASQSALGREYGVAQTTISAIIRKVNWQD